MRDRAAMPSHFHEPLVAFRQNGRAIEDVRACAMNFANPIGSAEIGNSSELGVEEKVRKIVLHGDTVRPAEGSDSEITANSLAALLGRGLGASTMEIQNLIVELQNLRKKLQTDGNRIQRDIEEYAALSQAVMQMTKIISESVKNLPD